MDLQLNGKTALVSGSTAGIGFAIARRLLLEGSTVIINGRSKESVDKAVRELKQLTHKGHISGVACDFSKTDEIDELLRIVPHVDILVNNAGLFEPKPFGEITDDDWIRFFNINVMSGIRLSRHYFPRMLEKNHGRIIFISSESALFIPAEMIHYGMTKTAQLAVSRGMAELTRGTHVTVNAVLPGPTKSQGVTGFIEQLASAGNITPEQVEQDFFKNGRPTSLLQRFASPDEVANLVAYLVSPLASATNGAAIKVDGGLVRTIY